MKFIDWFAGIGGFRRGMELAGHECVGFCEFDKYAVMSYTAMHLCTQEQLDYLATLSFKERQKEILKEEYRNGEWYANDIREVHGWNIPKADCWCFGAPCQDFSTSGNRSGLKGDRSSLVKEIFRILGEMQEEDRPEWLLYENVKGMLSSNNGFDFLAILLEMDRGGYDVQWQVLNSKDFGVPQSRDRVYTVGHLRRCGESEILPIGATDKKDPGARTDKIIIDDFYTSRPIRTYDKYAPTLRSDRSGLKVMKDIDSKMFGYNATLNEGGMTDIAHTLMARGYKGLGNQTMTIGAMCFSNENIKHI